MNGKRKQPSCSMEELNPCERMRMGRQPIEGCTSIFALRMRGFDVSLYLAKECGYSLVSVSLCYSTQGNLIAITKKTAIVQIILP